MHSNPSPWTASILLAGLLTLGLSGCADDEEGSTTTTTVPSETSSTQSTTTTTMPATTESTTTTTESTTSQSTTEPTITINHLCGDGDTGSSDIPTDDIEQIDDIVNTIDLCEFKGGLAEISFTAPCPSGDREVTVTTTDGAVPDIATLDLCENP